jgi:hypothetical protein
MLVTHTIYSLQLIVESFSAGAKQVAPATIHNKLFKLIVALASEGACFAPYIIDNAFTYANELNHEGVRAQANSFQASKLIVNYFEISFHFCEGCRIYREEEWQVKDSCYAIVKQRSANTQEWDTLAATASIGCVSLVGCIDHNGLVDQNGIIAGRTGPNGLIGVNCIFGTIDCNNQISRNNLVSFGFVGLNGYVGFISIVSLIGLIGRIGLNGHNDIVGLVNIVGHNGIVHHIGLVDCKDLVGLIGHNGLVGQVSQVGLDGLVGLVSLGLIGHTGLVSLISFVGGFISLIGLIGHISLISLVDLIGLIGLISLTGLIGFKGLIGIGLIGHVSLVGIVFNGPIGIGIIINSLEFEIETKLSQCYTFVREGWLGCVRRVLPSLAGLDSDFFLGLALQKEKQLFFSRLPQMTKYFVMRECEDIPTRNLYAVTQHLLTRRNFYF